MKHECENPERFLNAFKPALVCYFSNPLQFRAEVFKMQLLIAKKKIPDEPRWHFSFVGYFISTPEKNAPRWVPDEKKTLIKYILT